MTMAFSARFFAEPFFFKGLLAHFLNILDITLLKPVFFSCLRR
jgi:hypothetical protein